MGSKSSNQWQENGHTIHLSLYVSMVKTIKGHNLLKLKKCFASCTSTH